jgi:signal transduction histidine kinase
MNGVRDVMDSLSPTVLEHLGFYAAVEDCLRRAGERGGFKVRCKKEGPVDQLARLDLIEQTLLFRLVQECGNNITKHAQASMVKLRLEVTDKVLVLSISDNGVGIPEAVDVNESRGLKYMRQRGDLIGATIAWLAAEGGQGTTVEIRMPLKNRK